MLRSFFLCLILSYTYQLSAQSASSDIIIDFQPHYNGDLLQLSADEYQAAKPEIVIETLRFYVGQFTLLLNDTVVWSAQDYHLIDAADPRSYTINLKLQTTLKYDAIQFMLGIDSLTNSSGAYGGDLDPTKGMYWTWQNGYINFKLEGRSKKCPTRNHEFMFHLGGYASPFLNAQVVRLPIDANRSHTISLNIADFIKRLDLSSQHTFMSPSLEAVELSKMLSTLFYIDE
jgi:hypothetical protein